MAINVTDRTPNCKARNRSHALIRTLDLGENKLVKALQAF